MPRLQATVRCAIEPSFRARQVAGMFDLPLERSAAATFEADVPGVDEPWRIGLIVGPSAAGKSTLLAQAFGTRVYSAPPWPPDLAVVDSMGELPIKQIVGLFTAVGFGSPPSWLKPYRVLSGGERFRCDLARALATALAENRSPSAPPIVAFDEFTSLLDRPAAQLACAALGKALRQDLIACRFVAATCHADVVDWLAPDWVLDLAGGALAWRRLQRPGLRFQVFRCRRDAWRLFARHHYLTGELNRGARCYLGLCRQAPAAFCATLPLIGRQGRWRITRLVTLPDFQGLGLGMRLAETVAELHRQDGQRVSVTSGHPALLAHCQRSGRWRRSQVMRTGSRPSGLARGYRGSTGRPVVSFEYLGQRE